MNSRKTRRRLAAVLVALMAAAGASAQGERPTDTELGWLESFLMTPEERRASIRALSAGDRGAFRRLFWMRRDPTPDTPRNETLERYLARVRLAESNFRKDGYGGGGDRARVFVLLGLPVQTIPQQATEDAPDGLLWVYPPDGDAGVPAGLTAHYLADPDGRLWLENRGEVDDRLEPLRAELIVRPGIGFERGSDGRLLIPNLPAGGSERARKVLAGMAADESADGPGPRAAGFPFRVTPAYFRSGDGATTVALLFETPAGVLAAADDGQSAASVFARDAAAPRAAAGGPGEGRFRFETANTRIQPGGGPARFEASLVLPPGERRLLLGVVDEQSDAFGTAAIEVEAPAFPEAEPSFSSVVLYGETTPVAAAEDSPDRAFQFGRTHFRARSNGVFRRSETLGAFYFFYPGARKDDGELPEIVAEYTVLRDGQETGFVRPEALPTSTRQAAANAEIPLAQFAPGRYRLRIRIRYREDTYETGAAFTVTG